MPFEDSRPFRLCIVLLALPLLGARQKHSVVPLVPTGDWRLMNSKVLPPDAVRQWGGDPDVEREYGVKSLESRTFQLGDKVAEALVEQTPDASSAYGLLTFYRTPDMTLEKGMQLAVSGPEATFMARGHNFIRIPHLASAGSRLSDNELRALMISVAGTRSPSEARPSLPAPLPTDGLIPGSEKYILGPEAARRILPAFPIDLIGFSQSAELQIASYMSGKEPTAVVVVTYPTPQIARVRFGAMERFLAINQDHGLGSLYGKRQGSFVFLILNAGSSASATRLLDEFKVSQSVSWDQRYPGDESIWVQAAKLILANLALVGLLVLGAILGGGVIFLSRILAARWFPKSSWGNPEKGRIIRLNLS